MSQPPAPFQFIAGALCLDFINTVGSHASGMPTEKLNEFADLVRWANEAGLISQRETHPLLVFANTSPLRASRVLERARALRETLFRIFNALERREPPNQRHLTALNKTLQSFPIRLEVHQKIVDFRCTRKMARRADDWFLARVAWSAADLLTSDQVHQTRQCANATCGWFFVDATKNHSRRWCMMSDCGSLAKAKRYYQRKKVRKA